jgi:hypothetical protein
MNIGPTTGGLRTRLRRPLTTYGHLLPDAEDRTRLAVDAAWSSTGDAPVVASDI